MEMLPVVSSAIAAVGYDPISQEMNIRFRKGNVYTFCRVPAHVFEGLLTAPSKGLYYDRHIRGRYQC